MPIISWRPFKSYKELLKKENRMQLKEFLEELNIKELNEFAYFEAFSLLMEYDGIVPDDLYYDIFTALDMGEVCELMDSYLEEILVGVPDDSMDLYSLLSSYRSSMQTYFKILKEESNTAALIEEIIRFRKWYREEKEVVCMNQKTRESQLMSLCEALFLGRLERLAEGSYEYDFTNVLDYPFEEYDEEEDIELLDEQDEELDTTLIDRDDPVIDGENYEGEEELWQ